MPRKSLKKFLISAGTVCVLAPAALAATVIMHRGNGDAGFGSALQDAMEKVLLFGENASPPAASVANERSNADSSAKGQIPLGAGPYLSGTRLVDLMRYRTDFARLDLGDDPWPGNGAHGAPASAAMAAFAGVLGILGQQKDALASNGLSGGAGGSLPGMAWSGAAGAGGAGGSGGLPGMGGSGGSGSGSDALVVPAAAPAVIPTAGEVAGPAVTVVPLPATVWMLLAAFGALGLAGRRSRVPSTPLHYR